MYFCEILKTIICLYSILNTNYTVLLNLINFFHTVHKILKIILKNRSTVNIYDYIWKSEYLFNFFLEIYCFINCNFIYFNLFTEVISELQTKGCVDLPPNKQCLQKPLLCHVCNFSSITVQNLKLHLALTHNKI